MTCREVSDFLADYLSGELRADVRLRFEQHLAGCRDCVRYLDSYRKTIALTRAVRAEDGEQSAPVPEDLVRAILQAQQRERRQ